MCCTHLGSPSVPTWRSLCHIMSLKQHSRVFCATSSSPGQAQRLRVCVYVCVCVCICVFVCVSAHNRPKWQSPQAKVWPQSLCEHPGTVEKERAPRRTDRRTRKPPERARGDTRTDRRASLPGAREKSSTNHSSSGSAQSWPFATAHIRFV